MSSELSRLVMTRATAALAVGVAVLVPDAGGAWVAQADLDDGGVRPSALVQVDIDIATAEESSLEGTAEEIRENVATQLGELRAAQHALELAESAVSDQRAAIEATEQEIDVLEQESDQVVIGAYMQPPGDSAVDLIQTSSPADVAARRVLREVRADHDGDVLSALAGARGRLDDLRDEEEASIAAAEDARDAAAQALEDLQAAASQQVLFVLEVESRLERGLTEVHTVGEIDPDQAATLAAEQGGLASVLDGLDLDSVALRLAGVAPAPTGGDSIITPVSGGVMSVSCPDDGAIEVAGAIAENLQGLLNEASTQGLAMCGTGWRDPAKQVALRRQNCGASEFAIYQAPSSACSPPTARPGTSMHERGLAVDFTCNGRAVGRADACFSFLSATAADYGLHNLPSEPWHWSTSGG